MVNNGFFERKTRANILCAVFTCDKFKTKNFKNHFCAPESFIAGATDSFKRNFELPN